MQSAELEPLDDVVQVEAQRGAQMTDLTLIYNRHDTPADAVKSTAPIPPHSLAYIEGLSLTGPTPPYEHALMVLQHLRCTEGPRSEDYRDLHRRLTDDIVTQRETYRPVGRFDFTPHLLATLHLLLEKHCLVSYADYVALPTDDDDETPQDIDQWFRQLYEDIYGAPPLAVDAGSSLRPLIQQAGRLIDARAAYHDYRESSASLRPLIMAPLILPQAGVADLRRNAAGQLETYMTYGTTHARSLTQRFRPYGMEPRVLEVETLPEYQYLDPLDPQGGYVNRPRRLGLAMLSMLIKDFEYPGHREQILDQAYTRLEWLNTADPEQQQTFMVRCALAARASRRDFIEGYRQYRSVMRGLVADPKRYAPGPGAALAMPGAPRPPAEPLDS